MEVESGSLGVAVVVVAFVLVVKISRPGWEGLWKSSVIDPTVQCPSNQQTVMEMKVDSVLLSY